MLIEKGGRMKKKNGEHLSLEPGGEEHTACCDLLKVTPVELPEIN